MTGTVITIGAMGLAALFGFSIVWVVRRAFVRHDPERAAASVTVAANAPIRAPTAGEPWQAVFCFKINGDTDGDYDLLVSGEIVDERGGTRAFAVKTSEQSRIEGATAPNAPASHTQ